MRMLVAMLTVALVATPVIGIAAGPEERTVLAQANMTPTEKDAQTKLAAAGYSEIRDIKSGPEGVTAKAVKDGRTVVVVVDSAGRIKEQPAGQ